MAQDIATAAETLKENFFEISKQLFRADPDYKDVHVTFGHPGTFEPTDIVAWGGLRTEQDVANMSNSNRSRNEWIYLDVICSAFVGGGEASEQLSSRRSFAMLRKLEYFARITDTTIGGAVEYCFIEKTDSEGATDPKTLAKGRNVFVGATFKAKARIAGKRNTMTDQVTLIHNSPLGRLEIPGVGDVDPGEPFTVSAERADILLRQNELFRPAVSAYDNLKVDELKALAADRGLDATGHKADIISTLAFADQPPVVVTTEPVVDEPIEIAQPEEIQE